MGTAAVPQVAGTTKTTSRRSNLMRSPPTNSETTGSVPTGAGGDPGAQTLTKLIYRQPGFLIRRMQQTAVSIFISETRDYDVTPLQYGVMTVVRIRPGIDQIGLGTGLGLDRTTIVGIVDRLERKGWLTRRVADRDRRVRQLYLTKTGEERIVEVQMAVDRAQAKIVEPLSEDERALFISFLNRILSAHNELARVPVTEEASRAYI